MKKATIDHPDDLKEKLTARLKKHKVAAWVVAVFVVLSSALGILANLLGVTGYFSGGNPTTTISTSVKPNETETTTNSKQTTEEINWVPLIDESNSYASFYNFVLANQFSFAYWEEFDDGTRAVRLTKEWEEKPEASWKMELVGGGLLDFTKDGEPELVLKYENSSDADYVIAVLRVDEYLLDIVTCIEIYCFTEGFAGWEFLHVVEKDEKGAIYGHWTPYPEYESDDPADENFFGRDHGAQAVRYLEYQPNVTKKYNDLGVRGSLEEAVFYQHYYHISTGNKEDYQKWEVIKKGEAPQSGTAETGVKIPEIDEIARECEETYGTEWNPLSVNDLLHQLKEKAG